MIYVLFNVFMGKYLSDTAWCDSIAEARPYTFERSAKLDAKILADMLGCVIEVRPHATTN